MKARADDVSTEDGLAGELRSRLLSQVGERLAMLRSQRGITRRALSVDSRVSERHLANLERGTGNASILVLSQIATSLGVSLAELIGDETTSSAEWVLIRELLIGRSESDLKKARLAIGSLFAGAGRDSARPQRIALIGLRGAGKSTLGRMLAHALGFSFVELGSSIEDIAGCSVREIHDLYGASAYRRYERRALEEAIQLYPEVVIAAPGGIISDPATFNELLMHCTTIWLKAKPEEHMSRVIAQGDARPMSSNPEAMEDLKRILDGREAFYSKADHVVDTSALEVERVLQAILAALSRP